MKQSILYTGLTLSLGFLLISFQNCAKNGLAIKDNSTISTDNVNTDFITDGTSTVVDQTRPVSSPAVGSTPVKEITRVSPIHISDDMPVIKMPIFDEPRCLTLYGNGCGEDPKKPKDPVLTEAISLCKEIVIHSMEDETISDKRIVRINDDGSIKKIEKLRGKYIFAGMKAGAVIQSLSDLEGTQIFCGVKIKEIKKSKGRIILVNSQVEKWENHSGDLDLVSSQVKDLSQSRCTISKLALK